MPVAVIIKKSAIKRTPRVMQMEGMFDVSPLEESCSTWNVDFELPPEWNIGVIVGPSGAGKSTILNEFWDVNDAPEFPDDKSILDAFPDMPLKDIVGLLSSVGFSSPPSWLRPYRDLSNGEQFRVRMARILASSEDELAVDEFTSVIDRTVAKIGSSAIAKTVRRMNKKLVVASCHYDILDWLEPDWIYEPHLPRFQRGSLQRPPIDLCVHRCHHSIWKVFRKHHYLNTELNKASKCFVGVYQAQPVVFTAVLPFPHRNVKNTSREHRTVCLPDYQGVGIGNAMSAAVGSILKGSGRRFISVTSHPSMIQSRNRSKLWAITSKPKRMARTGRTSTITSKHPLSVKRLVTSFEYVGSSMNETDAKTLWDAKRILHTIH